MSPVDLARMNSLRWLHRIELGGGVVTPGRWDGGHIRDFLSDIDFDFSGKDVLDVGCFDGLWTFAAERAGAREVWAIDDLSKRPGDEQTFRFASAALGSRAVYRPNLTVYEIESLERADFEVVLFFGVLYHLVHPLLALARLRRMLADGGEMLIESESLDDDSESRLSFHYRDAHVGDRSNWFVPTTRCLREMVESCYLEIVDFRTFGTPPPPLWKRLAKRFAGRAEPRFVRSCIRARAVRREDPRWIRPDELLGRFDPRWDASGSPRSPSIPLSPSEGREGRHRPAPAPSKVDPT